ncbi:hypothetical protein CGRA01v4_06609 [Colletotrichum graminicola]|nr:hypothetical protein CGRA01v4_06609 [Colletotrichum graminicola]
MRPPGCGSFHAVLLACSVDSLSGANQAPPTKNIPASPHFAFFISSYEPKPLSVQRGRQDRPPFPAAWAKETPNTESIAILSRILKHIPALYVRMPHRDDVLFRDHNLSNTCYTTKSPPPPPPPPEGNGETSSLSHANIAITLP